jgi:predicted NUDIX family NTP pyrophosphohydrolase
VAKEVFVPKLSAGVVLYRFHGQSLEVFLVHPGGPFWKKKDAGAWSIPKGEYESGEIALDVARREFQEETGFPLSDGQLIPLGEIKQPSGKIVTAWALEGECSAEEIKSNSFSIEWPPKSGSMQDFPEVDRAEWFSMRKAKDKILPGQIGFLDRLANHLHYIPPSDELEAEAGSCGAQGSLFG